MYALCDIQVSRGFKDKVRRWRSTSVQPLKYPVTWGCLPVCCTGVDTHTCTKVQFEQEDVHVLTCTIL